MARSGEIVENARTGERIRFLATAAETGGERLEMEAWWPPGDRAVPHAHPGMEERWEILEGTCRIEVQGAVTEAGPGEAVVAPPGAKHVACNAGEDLARVRITMRPALRWEEFVERLFTAEPGDIPALVTEFPDEIAF